MNPDDISSQLRLMGRRIWNIHDTDSEFQRGVRWDELHQAWSELCKLLNYDKKYHKIYIEVYDDICPYCFADRLVKEK